MSKYWNFSASEIPQYRLPFDVVQFEVDLVKNLGVKFVTGRKLSTKDITVEVSWTVKAETIVPLQAQYSCHNGQQIGTTYVWCGLRRSRRTHLWVHQSPYSYSEGYSILYSFFFLVTTSLCFKYDKWNGIKLLARLYFGQTYNSGFGGDVGLQLTLLQTLKFSCTCFWYIIGALYFLEQRFFVSFRISCFMMNILV